VKCRECHSKGIIRLKRRRADKLLGYIIPIRPYRCQHCDTHLWGLIRWRHQRSAYLGTATFWAGMALLATAVLANLAPVTDSVARTPTLPAVQDAQATLSAEAQRVTGTPLERAPQTKETPSLPRTPSDAPHAETKAIGVVSENAAIAARFYATTDRAHLREGAGQQYPSITILGSDRVLPAVEPASGEWIRLRHYGRTGYVHRSLLRPAAAPDTSPQKS